MRPTIGETLSGTRRVLTELVLPCVSDDYAKAIAMSAIAGLAQLERRWDDLLPRLMEENDELRTLVSEGVEVFARARERRPSEVLHSAAQRVGDIIACAETQVSHYPRLSEQSALNERYKAALIELIDAHEAVRNADADDEELSALRQRIRTHLRCWLDRDVQAFGQSRVPQVPTGRA